jgi:transcriptional regulator with XRE-family HTH domain
MTQSTNEMSPEEIRSLRQRGGLSQADLARIVEVDRSAVSRWESGDSQPGRTQLEILKALRRELEQRDEREWAHFLMKAGGSLSLALFLNWLSEN